MKGPAEGRDMAAVGSEGRSRGWRGRVAVNWGSEVDGGRCVVTSARKAVEANWDPPRHLSRQAELASFLSPLVSSITAGLLVRYTRHLHVCTSARLRRHPESRAVPRCDPSLSCTRPPCLRRPGLLSSSTRQWSCSIASYCVTRVLRGFRTLRHPEVEDGGRRTAGMGSLCTVSLGLF